ncbi:hypothetical protein GF325_12400 [Candidatus Bathyarchaeota archaeon]|nr:hypothetical protein [Candidatus Bathyarchaeota archaeon]
MTSQIPDIVRFNGKEYDLAGYDGGGLFDPLDYIVNTRPASTACWRGFQVSYEVMNDKFIVDELKINSTSSPPPINDILPRKVEVPSMFTHVYENLDFIVDFTGKLVIGREFIQSMYVHMGFHGADCYKDAHQFTVEHGIIVSHVNISEQMAHRRKEGRSCKPKSPFVEEGGDGDVENWVRKRFSRRIDES